MVRSLWTAATGMNAQQTNVDTIANNLANVNTVGYKTQVNQFKSLLYQNLQTETTSANGANKPTGAQVGLGVRSASITTVFKTGNLVASENDAAFALVGDGFFAVRGNDGNTYYTKNGNFNWAINTQGGVSLCTAEGYPVLDSNGNPIELNGDYQTSKITISGDGEVCYPDESNNPASLGITIGVYQFSNPGGLEKEGNTMYSVTAASGPALNEATTEGLQRTEVRQGYLEGSNVQVVDEMVNLIVAQRAYEMNSKAITTTDEMMKQANNLKQ